jgi:hypothetical protein
MLTQHSAAERAARDSRLYTIEDAIQAEVERRTFSVFGRRLVEHSCQRGTALGSTFRERAQYASGEGAWHVRELAKRVEAGAGSVITMDPSYGWTRPKDRR